MLIPFYLSTNCTKFFQICTNNTPKVYLGNSVFENSDFTELPTTDQHKQQVTEDHKQCEAVRNVYYLKVHKTGSTTFSNILNRFGMKENCVFACFNHHHAYPATNMVDYLLPHPLDLQKKTTWDRRTSHKFNIVSVHTVYNQSAIRLFMPNNTWFVATTRHPLSQMISAFYHYKLPKLLNMTSFKDPVRQFLTKPALYDKPLPGSLYNPIAKKTSIKLSFTKNRMAFEFGFNLTKTANDTYVEEHLSELEKVFDVVLITEHYDESLLLLRENMCWTYKDIVYLQLRKQAYKEKTINFKEEYGKLFDNHKNWAPLDYAIYNRFLNRHRNTVADKGQKFQEEVQYFQLLQKEVSNFCFPIYNKTKTRSASPNLFGEYMTIKKSKYHSTFTVEAKDCLSMALHESFFGNIIFSKQYNQFCNSNSWKRNRFYRAFHFRSRCVKRNVQNPSTLYGFPLKSLRRNLFLSLN